MAENIKVVVADVNPTSGGWKEVTFEGGVAPASTKSQAVADAAFASRGSEVDAVINETKRGNFTNRYLNEIAGVSDGGGAGRGKGSTTTAAKPSGGRGKSPEEQDRIARQWAFGRATELLAASGEEFTLPLEGETLQSVIATAETLLEKTR
jgi:hypothetical protein